MAPAADDPQGSAPGRAGLVLVALILVAAAANLNLSVRNVALPSIGEHFAVLLSAVVFFCFPKMQREKTVLAEYHPADTQSSSPPDLPAGPSQPTPA
jgi:hypothetical protein